VKVEWLPVAVGNLWSQIAYLGERDPHAAIALGDAVEASVRRLGDHPRLGRSGRVEDTRELVVGGTPLVVVYRIEADVVLVLRLLHGAQRWPEMP
jgi:toxin ParE1/3/4